jgi:hypothetical protein
MATLTLSSPVFDDGGSIPSHYTCDNAAVSSAPHPPLEISGAPEGATSLALVVVDPDIPESVKHSMGITEFDHWVLWNIPPETAVIKEEDAPGVSGINSSGSEGYTSPCPPEGSHRYVFTLYALDKELDLPEGSPKEGLELAMEGHILEMTTYTGTYRRKTDS